MVLDGPVSETGKVSSLKPTVNTLEGRIQFLVLFLWLWLRPFAPGLVTEKKTGSLAWKQPLRRPGSQGNEEDG